MIHPNTELRKVSEQIGYGVFATAPIPKGTIVYLKDCLEIEISPQAYQLLPNYSKRISDWYSYTDEKGVRIISWDIAKYVNHNCDYNSISTGFGFEIAVRDILTNEEITDDYGLFNLTEKMACLCGNKNCRGYIGGDDWQDNWQQWDKAAYAALKRLGHVDQPLMKYMDNNLKHKLSLFMNNQLAYPSVLNLRYNPQSQPESKIETVMIA